MTRLLFFVIIFNNILFDLAAEPYYRESASPKSFSKTSSFELREAGINDPASKKVYVTSRVSSCEISFGQFKGRGGLEIDRMDEGIYELRVTQAGYQPIVENIQILRNSKYYIKINLEPKKAGLVVLDAMPDSVSSTSDTEVSADGNKIEPGVESVLNAGMHRVVIKKFGYKTLSVNTHFDQDMLKTIDVELGKIELVLKVQGVSRPKFNPLSPANFDFTRLFIEASAPAIVPIAIYGEDGQLVNETKLEISKRITTFDFFAKDGDGNILPAGTYKIVIGEGPSAVAEVRVDHTIEQKPRGAFNRLSGIAGFVDTLTLDSGDFSLSLATAYRDFAIYDAYLNAEFGFGQYGELGISTQYVNVSKTQSNSGILIENTGSKSELFAHLGYKLAIISPTKEDGLSLLVGLVAGTNIEFDLSTQVKFGFFSFIINPGISFDYIDLIDFNPVGRLGLVLGSDSVKVGIGAETNYRINRQVFGFSFGGEMSLNLPTSPIYFNLMGSYSPTEKVWKVGLGIVLIQSLF